MDETGLRVAGGTRWLHAIGDETVTAYRLGDRGDVWEGYAGTAVPDRFASYGSAMADETVHALCNAHLLRNPGRLSNWNRSRRAGRPACSGCCSRPGTPPTRGRGRRRGHNLALALKQEREACLRFMADPAVPFTHNRAERALRMAKVQHLKIAGCFHTQDGTERFALLRGLVETARQREWPLLDFLRRGPDAAVRPQLP